VDVNVAVLAGLVGVTVVITRGSIFDGLRDWLKGFEHPWNPLRLGGELISCPMCSGVWVGALWALADGRGWIDVVLFGGLVSLVAWPLAAALSWFEDATMASRAKPVMADLLARVMQAREAKKRQALTAKRRIPPNITEAEAEALMDEDDRVADGVIPGEEATSGQG